MFIRSTRLTVYQSPRGVIEIIHAHPADRAADYKPMRPVLTLFSKTHNAIPWCCPMSSERTVNLLPLGAVNTKYAHERRPNGQACVKHKVTGATGSPDDEKSTITFATPSFYSTT